MPRESNYQLDRTELSRGVNRTEVGPHIVRLSRSSEIRPRCLLGNPEVNTTTLAMEGSEPNRAADGRTVNKEDVLRDFQVSFFAMSGLASFPWTFLEKDLERNKSSDLISDILSQTCLHSLCRRFPPSARYRKLFLSQLITRQEAAGCDPLDALYDALAEVVGAGYPTECFKSYLLPGGEAISLLESVALVSDGTTGLLTWEAALHLAEWALDHRHPFTGRTVLELGSGAGLTGIAICRSCSPSRYVFSDCHPRVLRKLRDNVRLNGLTGPEVGVEEMDWTTATDEQIARIGADTVIAADVVYDPDVVESLVALLSRILRVSSPEVFICSTVRNQETYGGFKRRLGEAGIGHQVVPGAAGQMFPYSRESEIETLALSTAARQ